MPHLTEAVIKRLPRPKQGNRIIYDDVVAGFGCRVTAAGTKAYVLNYTVKGSARERRLTIGSFRTWSTTAARARARELRREIDNGGDPLSDIEAERAAPTVADLIDRFVSEHLPRLRPSSQADYRRMIENHIRAHFGRHVKVADVRFEDIDRLHRRITAAGHLHRANRVIAVLSKMFALGIRWNMLDTNPCRSIERHHEPKRKRYLSGEELGRLTRALAAYPDQRTADIFRLLLLTGARRGEVLSMRWGDLELSEGKWVKPGSTTKQKTEHEVPLSAPARQLLSEIRDAQSARSKVLGEYVFPGNGDAKHIVSVKRAWKAICKAAGISGLRIHDLRHSHASFLASGGASLPLIGALLGHSNPATTHRYSHLHTDPQRAAVEKVGALIASAHKPAKKPVPLKRGR
jgi:integrase